MKKTLLLFLGRNLLREDGTGILSEALESFPGMEDIVILKKDNDSLDSPENYETIPVSEFAPEDGREYTLVANGGTTDQIVPTLIKLDRSRDSIPYAVYNLQRDGVEKLV